MNWLEVSLTVNGELAEAVAEVLARFAPGGVVIESTAIYANPENQGYPVGPLRVCGYLPVDAHLEETRQRIEEALYFLGRIQPLPDPQFKPIEEVNWAEAWKQHFKPIAIGKKLIIVPAWLESPDESRTPIRIDPGMAFGTGTHPTTQLCLELIEVELLKEARLLNLDVLDIGCGSGILSIAALKLGAGRAFGVDTDPEAISAAKQNAADNGVADQTEFAVGSVAEILGAIFPVSQAPIVLANILAPIIIRLLDTGLGELVAPNGVLLLSGILEEQLPEMEAALKKNAFSIQDKRQIDDWVALSAAR
jgi:ribosomal protein L11 methyltransferase